MSLSPASAPASSPAKSCPPFPSQDPGGKPLAVPALDDAPEFWDHYALASGCLADIAWMSAEEANLYRQACARVHAAAKPQAAKPEAPVLRVVDLSDWPSANIGKPVMRSNTAHYGPGKFPGGLEFARQPDDPGRSPAGCGNCNAPRRQRTLYFISGVSFGLLISATISIVPVAIAWLK